MAITAVTLRGEAGARSTTALSVSPTAAITVGKIAFAACIADNSQTTDGASTTHAVTDTDGHTWTRLFEETETDGVAADGVTMSLWATKVTAEIGTGDAVSFDPADAGSSARGIVIFEATFGAGQTFAIQDKAYARGTQEVAIAGLPSREYLLVNFVGAEGEDQASTADADYTKLSDLASSTTGASDTNVCWFAGYRVATLTGDTATITALDVGVTNMLATLAAVYEVAESGPQNLTGTLFTDTPTFPTGVVSQAGVTQNLTGTLFAKAPTFPTGVVALSGSAQNLTGTLFVKAPTFTAGIVSRIVRTHYGTNAVSGVASDTSAAFTPAANSVLLVFVTGRIDSGVPTPTVTGHGLTWETLGVVGSSFNRMGWLFGALVGTSPSSNTLTVDFGSALDAFGWSIVGEAGTATGTLDDIVRVHPLYANDDLRTSFTFHQQAFADPTNDALGFWFIGNATTATVGNGWTLLGQDSVTGLSVLAEGRIGEGLVIDASWGTASHVGAFFACEVRASGSPTFGPVRDTRWMTRDILGSGNSLTTDTITPTADALVVLFIASGRSAGPQTPTSVIGNGITYTQAGIVDFATEATPLWRFTVWTGTSATPTAGGIAVTWANTQDLGRRWGVIEVEDVTGFVQVAVDAADTTTALAATLDAFSQVANPTFGLLISNSNQVWPTPGSGFQHIAATVGLGASLDRMSAIWRASNDTTADITFPTAAHSAFIALELAAAAVPISQIPNATVSNVGWDTAPLAGQSIHTYIATDDTDYITVTVP